MATQPQFFTSDRTIKEIHITLPDDVIDEMRGHDQVEIHLHSKAINREAAPIRLSYTAVHRLTVDHS